MTEIRIGRGRASAVVFAVAVLARSHFNSHFPFWKPHRHSFHRAPAYADLHVPDEINEENFSDAMTGSFLAPLRQLKPQLIARIFILLCQSLLVFSM
jgi:hypothetical protein